MSAICGIINFNGVPASRELLENMANAAAHRGPDGINYWIEDNVGFANLALHTTRESVRERQPLCSESGNFVLTADARVDNRQALIGSLTTRGFNLSNDSTDADLILAAYQCWEEDCPKYIIGDFAFAIWDKSKKKLFCARDTVGIRLFYYSLDAQTFRFATEISQILVDPRVSRDLDGFHLVDYLTYNWRESARSPFAAVQALLHAHCLVIDEHGPRCWRYWYPGDLPNIQYKSDNDYIAHFRELFTTCVKDHLRSSKGAVGILTSGGMDSPSIAATGQFLYKNGLASSQPVAYSWVFDTRKEVDERDYSLTLPAETGIEFHQIAGDYEDLDPTDCLSSLSTPVMLDRSQEKFLYNRLTDRDIDILITGDGGDVLFDPAKSQYLDYARTLQWRKVWPWMEASHRQGASWPGLFHHYLVRPLFPQNLINWIDNKRNSITPPQAPAWIDSSLAKQVKLEERLLRQCEYPVRFPGIARQSQYVRFMGRGLQKITTLMYNIYASPFRIEPRFPFLDRRLMDFMMSVPVHLGAHPGPGNTKWLLRQAMTGRLPERIRTRAGKTFTHGIAQKRLGGIYRSKVEALFTSSQMARLGIVNEKELLSIFNDTCDSRELRPANNNLILALQMEIWLRNFQDRIGNVHYTQLQAWQTE